MTTQAELNAILETAIDQLNEIMLGDENDTVTISSVVKPTISKDIADRFADLASDIASGDTAIIPLEWTGVGDGTTTTFTLSDAPSTDERLYFVEVGGVLQHSTEYTVTVSPAQIVFDTAPPLNASWNVRTFAVSVSAFAGIEQERIFATAGQTVFNLATITYTPGVSGISVYRNGSYVTNYVETDNNTLTFDTAANAGDEFDFVVNQRAVSADVVPSSSVTHTPPGGNTSTIFTYLNNRNIVNVKDFGAVGDMTGSSDGTDDYAAIAAAIALVKANGGGTVYFPSIGENNYYGISQSLDVDFGNVRFLGDTPSTSKIRMRANSNDNVFYVHSAPPGKDNVFFESLHLNGNKSNNSSGHGVEMTQCHALTSFKNCIISQCSENAVDISNSTVVLFENCDLTTPDGWSLNVADCLSIFINSCAMQFFGAGAMNITNSGGIYEAGIFVDGLHLELATTNTSSGYAIQLSGGTGTANQSINVGLKNVGFRATSAAGTDCIRVVDDNINLVGVNVSKTGFGALVSHFDATKAVSGVDTLTLYTYSGAASKSIIENLNTFGDITMTQASGHWLKLRRSNFAALRIGTDDNNDWEFQDSTAAMLIRRRNAGVVSNAIQLDSSTTAGQTRLLVYDVDNGTLERVTVGAADSGGAGFKVLRIPN